MRLSKIYSDNQKFKDIHFSNGLNVIIGDINFDLPVDLESEEGKALEHNLGKTDLLHLIDFLLLKDDLFVSDHLNDFKIKKEDPDNLDDVQAESESWVFFLEIRLNNGSYLTIRRSFNNPSKISFKAHKEDDLNLVNETIWDHENVGMSSKTNAKEILESNYLNFNVGEGKSFRQYIGYIMRTQDDYGDIFRLSKFRGKDKYWKPELFELLGFNGNLLLEKYELTEKNTEIQKKLDELTYSPDKDDISEINALLEAKKHQKISLKDKIDSFNFFQSDQAINKELTEETIGRIAELNREEYKINLSIQQIEKALKDGGIGDETDLDQISNLFKEIKIVFPNELKTSFSDVLTFCKKITTERNSALKKELEKLTQEKVKIIGELETLNKDWSEKIGIITESDGFHKYDKYREGISLVEAQIIGLEEKKVSYKQYKADEKRIQDNNVRIGEITKEVEADIGDKIDSNLVYKSISNQFTSIYKDIFEGTAVFFPSLNGEKNIEFKEKVQNSDNLSSGKGKGNTSKMALCASFALALILGYQSRSFFRVIYLDGVFEGWGDRHKKRFVEMIRKYAKQYQLQVIITIIRSDIPEDLLFEDDEIKKRLFKGGSELFGIQF